MIRLTNVFRIVLAFALLACPLASRADSIQLISTTANSGSGVAVYPYNFKVNGAASTISLACLNFDREVTIGEKWNVTIHGLDLGSSLNAIQYRADAILYSVFGKYGLSNSDVQYAIWSIFDPSVKTNDNFTTTSQYLVTQSLAYAVNSDLINSGFFNNFLLYTPTSDTTGWTAGKPQEFIGTGSIAPVTAATPEPSSIVLMGTAMLCGVVVMMRRRITAAAPMAY